MNAPNYIIWVDGIFFFSFTLEHAEWVVNNEKNNRGAIEAIIFIPKQ